MEVATCEDEIMAVLLPPSGPRCMTQIAMLVPYHVATVSSRLKIMTTQKKLRRRARFGPRGGFGYYPAIK